MPIKDCSGDVVGVAQVINKLGGEAQFTTQDEKVFAGYLQFCGIGLRNAQLYEKSQLEVKRNQVKNFWVKSQNIKMLKNAIKLRNEKVQCWKVKTLKCFFKLQVLLDLARMIFEEQSTIEHMVLRILTHTQSLIQCQRVQVNIFINLLFIAKKLI